MPLKLPKWFLVYVFEVVNIIEYVCVFKFQTIFIKYLSILNLDLFIYKGVFSVNFHFFISVCLYAMIECFERGFQIFLLIL